MSSNAVHEVKSFFFRQIIVSYQIDYLLVIAIFYLETVLGDALEISKGVFWH